MIAISKQVLAVAFSLCFAGSAFAQLDGTPLRQGSGRASAAAQLAVPLLQVDLGTVSPFLRVNNASFATGAVGLRNRGDGGIGISGVTTPVKRAFAYWAVVSQGSPNAAASSILLKKGAANGPFTTIVGNPIGTGLSPCWGGDRTTVYRAPIPLSLANGNGLYLVLLKSGANGSTAGDSPWVASNPPLFEGVSIVLIGTGTSTVTLYDAHFAGKMFYGQLTYALSLPVGVASASEVVFHDIGADGQSGVGFKDVAATAGETTILNGHKIAGPGSPAGGGDWNGIIASPLPQLWDNNTHTVTAAAKAGSDPNVLPFVVNAPDDCLVTVANLVSVTLAP